jgi:hypothetical protein
MNYQTTEQINYQTTEQMNFVLDNYNIWLLSSSLIHFQQHYRPLNYKR